MQYVFNKFIFFLILISCSFLNSAAQLTFVAEDLPPFHFLDENKKPTGALVEVIEALMAHTKLPYEIKLMPFARSYGLTSTKPNVVTLSLMKSAERQNKFKWIGQSYKSRALLVALSSRTDINIVNLEQAKSFIVGTIRGYYSEKYLKNSGFTTQTNLHLSTNYKHMWNMLFEKRVDFILTNYVAINTELQSIGNSPNEIQPIIEIVDFPGDLFLATGLSTHDETVNTLSNAMVHIKQNGTYSNIINKWGL